MEAPFAAGELVDLTPALAVKLAANVGSARAKIMLRRHAIIR
jgi:hypothetical protein